MVFIISDIFLLDLRVLIMDIYDVVCDIVRRLFFYYSIK